MRRGLYPPKNEQSENQLLLQYERRPLMWSRGKWTIMHTDLIFDTATFSKDFVLIHVELTGFLLFYYTHIKQLDVKTFRSVENIILIST